MKNYLFPKFFQSLSAKELAEYCVSIGIDGPTLLIRDGYWVKASDVFETLPAFVKCCEACGAEVKYADTPYDMDRLDALDDQLALMSANGIELFRVNYITKGQYPARELHDKVCHDMEIAEKAARKHGMRAVIQVHGGCYPHNATSAYFACKNFDPRYLGIKIDPGNNIAQEGYEDFAYQIALLGEYIAAIGQKDARLVRDGDKNSAAKGWRREFAPANEGVNNYAHIFSQMKKHGISVPGILMPFYHDRDFDALRTAFVDEVAYFKHCQEESGL
ncbi:MAG: TIM barrel protein [Clostridia bacterium]|nr:TIM barrel protein [Clostridia bacterium]